MSSSTVISSKYINESNLFMSLPDDSDYVDGSDGDENDGIDIIDDRSHSFSSDAEESSSRSSSLHIPLNDVNISLEPAIIMDSSTPSLQHVDSNISTSANTTIMSNIRRDSARDCASPPSCIDESESEGKRSIFGSQTKKKYNVRRKESGRISHQYNNGQGNVHMVSNNLAVGESSVSTPAYAEYYSPTNQLNKTLFTPPRTSLQKSPGTPNDTTIINPLAPLKIVGYQNFLPGSNLSPLTPAQMNNTSNGAAGYVPSRYLLKINDDAEDDDSTDGTSKEYAVQFYPSLPNRPTLNGGTNKKFSTKSQNNDRYHHAQALLLSIAFFFIWSPQNLLAPNLTQAADDFGYGDDTQKRDLYLGSNLALASSVLSLPFSALIGFASDVVSSRRVLISVTTFVGGMAAIGTGMSTTYPQLILSRFIGGSCMSGSVPVVFSLLSDMFDDKDRNSASSGFTAMMGAGILMGQVYAGSTGPTVGWRYPFYTSGILTMIFAILVLLFLSEPIRGGKEKVLQDMIERGGKYDKRLTWSQFVSSMTQNSSNCLLMMQGFFSNIPWGVMFVFLNDFLSQEKDLSVQDATFIVAVFGVGCAVGGILGGYFGGLAADRRYLPLFMSLTTMLGVIPFLALLDDASYDRAGFKPCFYAFAGGCLASMPSVNVRPCIINVNAPECRGAALTAANLIINAARGAGPSFLTTVLMGCFGLNRASGFNIMVSTR